MIQPLRDAFHKQNATSYRVLEATVWVLILVSVALLVEEMVIGSMLPILDWLDQVLLWLFTAEIVLRILTFQPAPINLFNLPPRRQLAAHVWGRIRFALQPMNLIDVLTVVALVPALRGLRALRLLRLIRTARIFRYSNPFAGVIRAFTDNALLYQFAFAWLGSAVFIGGTTMYLVERDANDKVNSLADGIWWALVTITTVGFGDTYPITPVGRGVGAVLMVAGIFTLALFAGIVGHTLLNSVMSIREEQFRMSTYANHLVICGFTPGQEMLLDRLAAELDLDHAMVVLFADQERPQEIPPDFTWVKGDPTKDSELGKIRLTHAKAVVVVGNRQLAPGQSDANTILTLFTIRRWMEHRADALKRKEPLYVVAEVLDAENVQHALTAGADEVIESTRVGYSLLAHAVTMPGTAHILSEVAEAGGNSLFIEPLFVDGEADEVAFSELVTQLQASHGVLVVGVKGPTGWVINPPATRRVKRGEGVVYLATKRVLGAQPSG
jgi:voltage-gated potassium channel